MTSSSAPSASLTDAQNPRLIYLPGMDGTGDLFYLQAEVLRPFFPICEFRLDDAIESSWDSLTTAVMHQCPSDAPVVLCGESFGGCLAFATAACIPNRVAGVIAVNPATPLRNSLVGWAAELLRLVPDGLYRELAGQGLGWLAELSRLDDGDIDRFRQAVKTVSRATAMQRLLLLREFDVNALPLEDFAFPTLLVASQGDRLLSSVDEAYRLAARLPDATVEILPQSGHACLLERDT